MGSPGHGLALPNPPKGDEVEQEVIIYRLKADQDQKVCVICHQEEWWVLHYIDQKKLVTADDIYKDSECGDIAMYLALHQLVTRNLIEGLSPYDERSKGHNHHQMQFRRAMNDQAMLFSHAAERMAKDWDADEVTR